MSLVGQARRRCGPTHAVQQLGVANRARVDRSSLPGDGREPSLRLADAAVGSSVVIQGLADPDDATVARLEHMGFLPGTVVKVERRAPMGDPTIYELRGYRLALRRESAGVIDVTEHAPMDGGASER